MFLYTRLVLTLLSEATSVTEMRDYLKGLPPGLDEMLVSWLASDWQAAD